MTNRSKSSRIYLKKKIIKIDIWNNAEFKLLTDDSFESEAKYSS